MFELMMYFILGPGLYLLCFIAGMLFKRYVLDIIRNWVINKVKPGIIQSYLEDALGMNKKQVLPPVIILPVQSSPVPVAAPVVQEPQVIPLAQVDPAVVQPVQQ